MTRTKHIEVVPYSTDWPSRFEEEKEFLEQTLKQHAIAIHHIGSTSVPGLVAKNILDILCAVDALSESLALEKVGYIYKGEFNIPLRAYFSKAIGDLKVNLHVVEQDHGFIALNLCFRDYLRAHDEAREAYAQLKEKLLQDPLSFQRLEKAFTGYNLGKDEFIKDILRRADFKGLTINFCMHHREWGAARQLRQTYFFDRVPMDDPYTWTFDHPDHVHFVLYQGADIIGYAHVQLWPEKRAALRIIVIDEPYRNHGFGGKFLAICEKWLKQQGYAVLHTDSSPAAHRFYQQQGYQSMPFNDPDGYESDPQDIPMGKMLDFF